MSETHKFEEFPKIARLSRGTVVSEKIDGTNAQILVVPIVEPQDVATDHPAPYFVDTPTGRFMLCAGSRNRWITPTDDNFGFAKWVVDHACELTGLGAGRHFGEWWGSGIQRGYGLSKGEKRWSLFNAGRWRETPPPACCSVVPVLYEGDFDMQAIHAALDDLRVNGSRASPGFMQPEGVVVYHAASRTLFKKTILKDSEPKSMVRP